MIINGKEYRNVPITFNVFCKLEEMGVSVTNIENQLFTAARAYAGICMKKPAAYVGNEIEQHVINGGKITDIVNVFSQELEKSDFFQAMARQTAEEAEETPETLLLEEVKTAEA